MGPQPLLSISSVASIISMMIADTISLLLNLFESEDEKLKMINLFKPSVPKARADMPALKIMMLKSNARGENDLFCHDTLYNIEIKDLGSKLVMECWTGDMQLTGTAGLAGTRPK